MTKGRKSAKSLERRIAAFEAIRSEGSAGRHRIWVRHADGKLVVMHRPGSNKK